MEAAYPMLGPAMQRCVAGVLCGALAVGAAIGCSPRTHTVGQVQAESEIMRPPNAEPSAGTSGGGGESASAAGQGSDSEGTGQPSADAGIGGSGVGGSGIVPAPAGSAAVPPPIGMEPDFDCGSAPVLATRRRLDIYLMVDRNMSLPFVMVDPWSLLRAGISNYVEDERAAGTGLAIDYFSFNGDLLATLTPAGQREACDDGKYADPSVPMATLPSNAAAIQRSIENVVPFNASDMLPALNGALRYTKSLANSFPDTKKAVVLVTDGFVDLTCGSDEASLLAAAQAGARQAPQIPTYVIAIDELDLTDFINPITGADPLDAIASGGGTLRARHVAQSTADEDFPGVMLSVQHDAEPCDFTVPQFERDDPGRLSFGVDTPIGEPPVALTPRSDPTECGSGYYFDDDRNWLTLCPSTCGEVRQTGARMIWFTDC